MKQKLYLSLEKPVVLHPQLVKLFGDINQALFWQQIYYWSDKGQDPDGWIYKNKEELEEETTLSRYQQDRARKKLEEMGYLETKIKKANGSPTLHYKVDIGKVRNLLMEKRETYYSISEKLTIPYTENTTENTTDMLATPCVADTNLALEPKPKERKDQVLFDLIEKFKPINPTYKRFFENKTQRGALERLVKEFGEEQIGRAIDYLPKIFGRKYAPRIVSPYQLEAKLADLIAYIQSEKNGEKIIFKI